MNPAAFTIYKWIGIGVALVVATVALILGIAEEIAGLYIVFYTVATLALVAWVWNYVGTRWTGAPPGVPIVVAGEPAAAPNRWMIFRGFLIKNRIPLIGLLILVAIFIVISLSVEGFFTIINIISMLVLLALLIFVVVFNRFAAANKSGLIGLFVLFAFFIIASLTVEGFFSFANIRSMLVFAAFLGLACVGQTLVALLGGLDLSIPFVIGSANVALLYILGLGIPSWLAVIIILLLGALIGLINGFLSFRLQGQALILTLGTGFAISGGTQILTSIGTRYSGNVFGVVPEWLTNIAAMNGTTFGLDFPPVILIWLVIAVAMIIGMRNTIYGRNLYALGGNRTSARRLSISERRYWMGVYTISGCAAALTGVLLLGWSGGGFIGVGDPYLFMTLAAVVIGGTSLLGGAGGYGYTIIGVLVLQVLTSFLVGIGLSFEGQQFVFGLLILPMVALYARSPHIRTQI